MDQLETRPLQVQQRQLAAAKVKYIIINRPITGLEFAWPSEDGPREQYPLIYPVVYDGSDLKVLRVY